MLLPIHRLLSHGSKLAVAASSLEEKTKIGQFSIAPLGFYHRFYTYKGLVTRLATIEQSSLQSRKLNCYMKSEECNRLLMLML